MGRSAPSIRCRGSTGRAPRSEPGSPTGSPPAGTRRPGASPASRARRRAPAASATRLARSAGSFCKSASSVAIHVPRAARKPAAVAPDCPTFVRSRISRSSGYARAAGRRARPSVASVEPSLTIRISNPARRNRRSSPCAAQTAAAPRRSHRQAEADSRPRCEPGRPPTESEMEPHPPAPPRTRRRAATSESRRAPSLRKVGFPPWNRRHGEPPCSSEKPTRILEPPSIAPISGRLPAQTARSNRVPTQGLFQSPAILHCFRKPSTAIPLNIDRPHSHSSWTGSARSARFRPAAGPIEKSRPTRNVRLEFPN